MKRNSVLVLILMMVAGVVGACAPSDTSTNTIVTSFYPLEFVTRSIVGDDFIVKNVTPVGAEPHDIELTPSATELILDAKLVIVMGDGFQPSVEKTAESRDGKTLDVLNKVTHQEHNVDPHVWLDPVLMKKLVGVITEELIKLKPEHKSQYEQREKLLRQRVDHSFDDYDETFMDCKTKTFITSHDAFSRLAHRFGLTQESIAGLSPENEPSPERLTALSKLARRSNISVIFTEDLVSSRVAQTLSRDAGLTTKILSPIEGLTKTQKQKGLDYFDLMEINRALLSSAMKCAVA